VDWFSLVLGALFAVGFVIWTVYLVRDGFTAWALLTGFGVVVGVQLIVAAFETPRTVVVDGNS
jgi:hypothetical protein